VDAWDHCLEVVLLVSFELMEVHSIHPFLFPRHRPILMLLKVQDLYLVVECVLIGLSLLLFLVLEQLLKLSLVAFLPFPFSDEILHQFSVRGKLVPVLLNLLAVIEVSVQDSSLPGFLLLDFLLEEPLLMFLLILVFNLVELALLLLLLGDHHIHMVTHPLLHLLLIVLEEVPIVVFPLDFSL